MTQAKKIIDIPLADVAPPEVRERLTSPEFARLVTEHNERKASWEQADSNPSTSKADLLRAFDAYKVARHRLEAYKDVTASLLPSREVPE